MQTQKKALGLCLTIWQTWMSKNDRDTGYASMRFMASDYDAYGEEGSDSVYARRDNEIGSAVDASVDCLSTHEIWALKKHCGIARLWPFKGEVFDIVLNRAMENLEALLRRNIATRTLFD